MIMRTMTTPMTAMRTITTRPGRMQVMAVMMMVTTNTRELELKCQQALALKWSGLEPWLGLRHRLRVGLLRVGLRGGLGAGLPPVAWPVCHPRPMGVPPLPL